MHTLLVVIACLVIAYLAFRVAILVIAWSIAGLALLAAYVVGAVETTLASLPAMTRDVWRTLRQRWSR